MDEQFTIRLLVAAGSALIGVLVLFLLVMWARWTIIPMPDAFFPRWARPVREHNRQAEAATKKLIRRT